MGRPSKPWIRASDGCWCITFNGKKVNLGVKGKENKRAALEAFAKLKAASPVTVEPSQPSIQSVLEEVKKLSALVTVAVGEQPAPTLSTTVRQIVDQFLEAMSGLDKYVLAAYRRFLIPFAERFANTDAERLTAPIVEDYSRSPNPYRTQLPKWSASTRAKFIGVVLTAFRWAERTNRLTTNPLKMMKRPPIRSRAEDVVMTEEEFNRLLAAATPQFQLILRFLWNVGCRPSECSRITAADIDWNKATVTLIQHKTEKKTGKKRTLYLNEEALGIVKELAAIRPVGTLFRSKNGNSWECRTLGMAMTATRNRAGLDKNKIVYSLRHSYCTDGLAKGVPEVVMAELVGNSVDTLRRNYSHIGAKKQILAEAAKKVR